MSYAFCYDEAGSAYLINPYLLQSIAGIESGFASTAIHKNRNGSVDIGLMQVNSAWIQIAGLEPRRLLSDPCYNVMTGARILKNCIDRYGYTWEAVGCYNASSHEKRVAYSWKIYNNLKSEVGSHSPHPPPADEGQEGGDSERKTPHRSFFFTVRDKAALE